MKITREKVHQSPQLKSNSKNANTQNIEKVEEGKEKNQKENKVITVTLTYVNDNLKKKVAPNHQARES